jgi:acetyl esterase
VVDKMMGEKPQRKLPDRSRLLPELREMLDAADALDAVPMEKMSPQQARAQSEIRLSGHWGEKDDVTSADTFDIPSGSARIRARLYRWAGTAKTIVFFHGGGWMVGSLETHDGPARALVHAAAANVLSVEYRKAPEDPFPAGLNDAESALRWLLDNGGTCGLDADRIIVAGDSAGASIAAALAIRMRDCDMPLFGQALIYPATDLANDTPSRRQFAEGYSVSGSTLRWFAEHYLSAGTLATDPYASPLLARDLSHLPPTLLITADHDPLRDEGRAYAQRLIAAGNDVCYEEWRGTVHGFLIMDRTTAASRKVIARIGEWANSLWNTHR